MAHPLFHCTYDFSKLNIAIVIAFLSIILPLPVVAGAFTAFGPQTYIMQRGKPVTKIKKQFTVLNPNTTYTLRITNVRVKHRDKKDDEDERDAEDEKDDKNDKDKDE